MNTNPNGNLFPLDDEDSLLLVEAYKPLLESDLSRDQKEVYDVVLRWIESVVGTQSGDLLTVGGYAGTGKSTVVGVMATTLAKKGLMVGYCAYTGKAANVLRRKMQENKDLQPGDYYVGTIHNLIYRPVIDEETGELKGFGKVKALEGYDLIVIDEASMVSEDIFRDLGIYGIPILAVGDHGQLPPVGSSFSLMKEPNLRLEKIHRQAEDNPIIALSVAIREGRGILPHLIDGAVIQRINYGFNSQVNKTLSRYFQQPEDADTTVCLCGFNKTRVAKNKEIQRRIGLGTDLLPISAGDRLICLKNSYFPMGMIANGSRGKVTEVSADDEHWLSATLAHREDGFELRGRLSRYQINKDKTFSDFSQVPFQVEHWNDIGLMYDLGYTMTVHKAQGSQFPRVIVFCERFSSDDDSNFCRWLYTAVTRAQLELIIVN